MTIESITQVASILISLNIPVFVLAPGSKMPLRGSNGCSGAKLNYEEIAEQLQTVNALSGDVPNLGVATGTVIDVIDFDGVTLEEGQPWEDADIPEPFKSCGLTPLAVVRTPKGIHWWIPSTGLSNAVRMQDASVDYRGRGGYVVSPESWTQFTQYKWLKVPDWSGVNTPNQWRDLLISVQSRNPTEYASRGHAQWQELKSLPIDDIIERVGDANRKGERNNLLFAAAGVLATRSDLHEDVRERLATAAKQADPSSSDHRISMTIRSGSNHGTNIREGRIQQLFGNANALDLSAPPEVGEDPTVGLPLTDLKSLVEAIENGEYKAAVPEIGIVPNSEPLFYRGAINEIHGMPGCGKSWLALHTIKECVARKESVLFLDWEDTAANCLLRLKALGANLHQVMKYMHYVDVATLGMMHRAAFLATLEHTAPTMVVFDSVGEAMGASGLDVNADKDVAMWFAAYPGTAAKSDARPAVLLVDHVVKNEKDRGHWAAGSYRKLAAVSGAAYLIETLEPFSRNQPGRVQIIVAKDRGGCRPVGTSAAVMTVHPENEGEQVLLTLAPYIDELEVSAKEADAMSDEERAAQALAVQQRREQELAAAILSEIEEHPGISVNGLRERVRDSWGPVRSVDVNNAIKKLVDIGGVYQQDGPRGSKLHYPVDPKPLNGDNVVDITDFFD